MGEGKVVDVACWKLGEGVVIGAVGLFAPAVKSNAEDGADV